MANLPRASGAGKTSSAPNLIMRCMELAEGHAKAALLLMRILFWMPKATVRHKGHTFVAKSRQEWAAEAGISFDQCKRGFVELRRLGLVATEQHKFFGRNITHVRLTGRALALLLPPGVRGGSAPPKWRKPARPERCTSAPLSIQGDTYKERQQEEDCVLAHATAPNEDSGQEDAGAKCKNNTPTPGGLVEPEIPPKSKPESTCADSAKPDSVPVLEQIWQEIVADTYGGFVPNWTNKERRQMRHFRDACPPGAAAPVLETCLRDWALFGVMAKSNAGAWDLPTRPTVAFLLKFVGVAVNFWQAKTKPKVPAAPNPDQGPPKPQQTPPQPIVKPAPGEEKASAEMVMAALFESLP
jgi:hypothetical protein